MASLQKEALGVWESIIMGIAGTAPAFSVEVTATTIIVAVGVLSVASILYCGLIMFGITFAFINLNEMNPNGGASFAWVGQIFGPTWGFFAGWSLLVACWLFMVSGTIPSANAFLIGFAPDHINNVHLITIIAAILLTLISLVVLKGIKLTSYVQVVMTVVELMILTVIGVVIGAALTFAVAAVIPPELPFALSYRLVVMYGIVLLVVGLVGTLLSLRRIASIDPMVANGRTD